MQLQGQLHHHTACTHHTQRSIFLTASRSALFPPSLLLLLYVSFPVCLSPHRSVAAARNLFAAVVGLALVYYPFGSHVVHGVITSLATYLVMWLVPRKCGTLAWLICFPYLTVL